MCDMKSGISGALVTLEILGITSHLPVRVIRKPSMSGTFRLAQIAGISVFLHWSWFLVAIYEVNMRGGYSSYVWNVLEYVSLFGIVTMHEFGHALACRQVGDVYQLYCFPL